MFVFGRHLRFLQVTMLSQGWPSAAAKEREDGCGTAGAGPPCHTHPLFFGVEWGNTVEDLCEAPWAL